MALYLTENTTGVDQLCLFACSSTSPRESSELSADDDSFRYDDAIPGTRFSVEPVGEDVSESRHRLANAIEECAICLSPAIEVSGIFFLACGHGYCKDCLLQYIRLKIVEGQVTEELLTCPEIGCSYSISPEELFELAEDVALIAKYEQFYEVAKMERNPLCIWCPQPGCCTPIVRSPNDRSVKCPTCNYHMCVKCRSKPHGRLRCKQIADPLFDEWKKSVTVSEGSLGSTPGVKDCPRCGMNIWKNGGCQHMTCSRCEYQWCWWCLGDWTAHRAAMCACLRLWQSPLWGNKKPVRALTKTVGVTVGTAVAAPVVGVGVGLVAAAGALGVAAAGAAAAIAVPATMILVPSKMITRKVRRNSYVKELKRRSELWSALLGGIELVFIGFDGLCSHLAETVEFGISQCSSSYMLQAELDGISFSVRVLEVSVPETRPFTALREGDKTFERSDLLSNVSAKSDRFHQHQEMLPGKANFTSKILILRLPMFLRDRHCNTQRQQAKERIAEAVLTMAGACSIQFFLPPKPTDVYSTFYHKKVHQVALAEFKIWKRACLRFNHVGSRLCHFTSPFQRWRELVTEDLLKELLSNFSKAVVPKGAQRMSPIHFVKMSDSPDTQRDSNCPLQSTLRQSLVHCGVSRSNRQRILRMVT